MVAAPQHGDSRPEPAHSLPSGPLEARRSTTERLRTWRPRVAPAPFVEVTDMDHRSQVQVESWLRAACADADRRGLPALKPLLESLAQSTAALREAERTIHDAGLVPGTTIRQGPAVSPGAETTE